MGVAATLTIALLEQICIMFALMGLGAALFRVKLISEQTSKDLGAVLLNVVFPVVIVRSFWGKYSDERLALLGITFVLAVALLVVACLLARVFFRQDGVAEFAAAFSNAGFIGIPLVQNTLGEQAVFLIASFISLLNVAQVTYGKWRISRSTDAISVRAVITNPMLIGLVAGIALFCLRTPVPHIASGLMDSVAALNSPFAMIILGVYLARSDMRTLFMTPSFYAVSAVRLLVVPIASCVLLYLMPCDQTAKLALLIAAAAPTGSNVAIFCQQLGFDTQKASNIVCLSTICSLATIPIVVGMAETML